jgi:hypothetical protein
MKDFIIALLALQLVNAIFLVPLALWVIQQNKRIEVQ